jgi:hypothetical protein
MRRSNRRSSGLGLLGERSHDDVLAGVANLFDVGVLLALGFMIAFLSALNLLDLFTPNQKVTIVKEKDGGLEVMIKEGQKTTIRRLTKDVGSGDGVRLGSAYRLGDGSVVYVPDAPSGN